jgi:hypothetical protein
VIESNKLFLIVATEDVLFKYNPPPEPTEEIDLNVVSSTSTTPAFSTYTAPPSVAPVVLPVMPTSVPFAKKYELRIVRPLVELPINVPTTPCVDATAEMPGPKKSKFYEIFDCQKRKKKINKFTNTSQSKKNIKLLNVVPFIFTTTVRVEDEEPASLKIAPLVDCEEIPLNVPLMKSTVESPSKYTKGFVEEIVSPNERKLTWTFSKCAEPSFTIRKGY